jgi:8-oxo-dGTP pyrophosphatase MutT (NUDIX family)
MSIKTLSSREVYRNPWLRLREDQIERSNGARGIYGVVEKDDCALIIPIQDQTIYLIEQFRYPIQQRSLELPQGGWETADVDPEELARGELREETGLIASTMTFLGTLWVAYGYARQKMHVFLATGLTPAGAEPDPEEHDLVLRTASIADFRADAARRHHPGLLHGCSLGSVPALEGTERVVKSTPPDCFWGA